jgi:regulatory protein YycI of two-component signal transduction system YycFG
MFIDTKSSRDVTLANNTLESFVASKTSRTSALVLSLINQRKVHSYESATLQTPTQTQEHLSIIQLHSQKKSRVKKRHSTAGIRQWSPT